LEDLKNTTVKNAYLQALADEGLMDKFKEKSLQDFKTPLFKPNYLSEEDEPKYTEVHQNTLESIFDIMNLSFNCIDSAYDIENLLSEVDLKIASIQEKIDAEDERVKDINMICGNISDFNSIIPITSGYFSIKSNLYQYRNCITSSKTYEKDIPIKIVNINGNGYSGNEYVVSEQYDVLQKELFDTSLTENVFDGVKNSAWEYSRLFSYDAVNKSDLINIDDIPATVQITLESQSEDGFNELVFDDDATTHITKIEVSDNNVEWRTVFNGDIQPNKQDHSYSDFTYIYGSGALVFPVTQLLRITMYSNAVDSKKIKINDQIKDGVYRKFIKIDAMQARRNSFKDGSGTTQNIITSGKAVCAGIFCNEYIPDFIQDALRQDIQYQLIVNGVAHNVVSVNSDKKGIKLVKYSKNPIKEKYVEYIDEPITTLQIAMMVPVAYDYSPYIANLKLCLGKQVSNV
jgi:hypothetical protein